MKFWLGFECAHCGREQGPADDATVCAACGGNLLARYDLTALWRKYATGRPVFDATADHYRFADFLPLATDAEGVPRHRVGIPVGGTPLIHAGRASAELGITLHIKDDGRNPSASFKDRASSVALSKAMEVGDRTIAGASTGNAGSSMACLAATVGRRPIIFVPKAAPKAKIAQLLLFGARVVAVNGTYDDAFDLCLRACARFGWVCRNTGFNPFTREGKKTAAFEICEQLGWRAPDYVLVSAGDGNIVSGVAKGFAEFHAAGLIEGMPRIVAVQAERSNAIARALAGDGKIAPVRATTLADSISVDLPRDGEAAVKLVRGSDGFAVEVTDEAILENIRWLAGTTGVFAEPAAATTFAGLRKLVAAGTIPQGATVVAISTGSGLKDVDSALKAAGSPFPIEPSLSDLESKLPAILAG